MPRKRRSLLRSGEQRPDGSVALSSIDKTLRDLERFHRFQSGEDMVTIASRDGLSVDAIKTSVRRGWNMFEAEQQIKLKHLKYQAAIANEEIRSDVRERVKNDIVTAIQGLLKGERTIAEVSRATGEVTLHTYIDPEMVALGIEAARKTISLEEKPSVGGTVVNIQQNNMGDGGGGGGGASYEERLERIKLEQSGIVEIPAGRQIYEVQATEVSATPDVEKSDEEPLF